MAINLRNIFHSMPGVVNCRQNTKRFLLCLHLLLGTLSLAQAAVEIDFNYDDLNRLTGLTRSDGPSVEYQYDQSGNFTTQGVSNSPDTDGDLIANFADPDDDEDGMPDEWELAYGLDPLDPADASLDSDGDGVTNLAEFQGETDPLQPNPTNVAVPAVPDIGLLLMAALLLAITLQSQKKQGR